MTHKAKQQKKQRMNPRRVFVLYQQGLTVAQIAMKYRRPIRSIRVILEEQGIIFTEPIIEASGHYIPTPEQIEKETEAIQKGWSESDRKQRQVGDSELLTVSNIQYGSVRRKGYTICQ